MPAYEPGTQLRIVLDWDEAKDPKPAFIAKALSRRESMALLSRLESMGGTFAEQNAAIDNIIAEHLLEWENIDVPFTLDAVNDVLGNSDAWRLAFQIAKQIGVYEKKA
jgi:hypothetical protein